MRPDWQRRGVALAGPRAWPRFNNIMRDFCLFWRSAFLPSLQRVHSAKEAEEKARRQYIDDDGLKMAEPDMSDSEMLRSQSSSAMKCCALRAPQPASESLRARHSKVAKSAVLAAVFGTEQHSNRRPWVHRAHGAQGLRQGCRTGWDGRRLARNGRGFDDIIIAPGSRLDARDTSPSLQFAPAASAAKLPT